MPTIDTKILNLINEVPGFTYEVTATSGSALVPDGWEATITAYNHNAMPSAASPGNKAGIGKGKGATMSAAIAAAATSFAFTSE
jgi:hypothetical protein